MDFVRRVLLMLSVSVLGMSLAVSTVHAQNWNAVHFGNHVDGNNRVMWDEATARAYDAPAANSFYPYGQWCSHNGWQLNSSGTALHADGHTFIREMDASNVCRLNGTSPPETFITASYQVSTCVNGSRWTYDKRYGNWFCETGYYVSLQGDSPANGHCSCDQGRAATAHPIEIGTGNMSEEATDFSSGDGRLRFERHYNSNPLNPTVAGRGWKNAFEARHIVSLDTLAKSMLPGAGTAFTTSSTVYSDAADACTQGVADVAQSGLGGTSPNPTYQGVTATYLGNGQCQLSTGVVIPVMNTSATLAYQQPVPDAVSPVVVLRPDGNSYTFACHNGACNPMGQGEPSLSASAAGFTLVAENGDVETYDINGNLQTIASRDGYTQTVSHNSDGTIHTVIDNHGRQLLFGYNISGLLGQLTLPDQTQVVYGYDASNHLTSVTYADASVVSYQYGSSTFLDALTAWVDENNVTYASWQYDPTNGMATSSALAGNVDTSTLVYAGNATTLTDNLGTSRTYNFQDVAGGVRLTSINGPVCADCIGQAMTYDSNGYLHSAQDWAGNQTQFTYDAHGLLLSRVEAVSKPEQRRTDIQWNAALRVPVSRTISDTSGTAVATTAWAYNASGQPLAQCDIDPAVSAAASYVCSATGAPPTGVRRQTFTYCDSVGAGCPLVGLLLSSTGPRTDVTQTTSYAYYLDDTSTHRHGDLKTVTDALGHVTTLASYDGAGRITRTIDPNSTVTDYTYTPRGWLASRTVRFNPDGSADTYNDAITKISYTAYGAVQTITDADGVKITYGYDAAHRLTTITDALGNVLQYTLDASDNRTAEKTFATGSSTPSRTLTRTYNTLGHLTQVVDGLNHTVFDASASGSYDGNGNLLQSSDANGIVHQQSYDALNRLVQSIDNLNGADTATRNTTTIQSWDALDRLTKITDPSNLTTTYGYDGLSNPISLSSPDSGTSYASFDAAGNMISRTDANGITVSHSYDALDRRLSDSYADSTLNASYHYDDPDSVVSCSVLGSPANPIGHLTRIVESTVTTTRCYDHNDRLTLQTQLTAGHTDSTEFYFSLAGRLGSRIAPDNVGVFYNYDSAGRVVSVTIPPGAFSSGSSPVQQITYLPFGPMTSYRLGHQIITRTYDANYALTDITSAALNLHFARDPLGNITALGNAPGASPATETYTYDPLNRLTGISDAGTALESYTYSPTGDRQSKTAPGLATGAYLYTSGTHQLASINGISRANDANGNTTGASSAGQTWGYGYNGRNRMTVVQANGATVGNYIYNALGQRIQKNTTAPTATTQRYFYDEQSHLIGEYTVGGSNRDTIWLGDMPVATVDTTGSTSVVNFVIGDGLGTPRAVVNDAGTTIWSWAYQGNPFGEQQPTSSTGYVLNLRYPGQYYDVESGTNYNLNRTYESATGRYLQSDPLGLNGGISTYAYVGGNPLSSIDPLGLNVTMTCRPLSFVAKFGGTSPKHCGDFVWHWATDPCTGKKHKVIDAQFSLPGFATAPTIDPNNQTYQDDRNAFYNEGGGNSNYNIPPPPGMTQAQFDQNVTSWGNQYSQGEYRLFPGPNSNSSAYDIIRGGGGNPPDVPDAPGNLYYVTPRYPSSTGQ
jgi:RHS repeat-associated protein